MKVSRRATLDRYYVVKFLGCALFVHRIHHSDPAGVYHSHPWSWVSIILGSYLEAKPGEWPQKRWGLNWLAAGAPHRVVLLNDWPVWTVFFHGPRRVPWVVVDEDDDLISVEPWRGVENPEVTSYVPVKKDGDHV